MRGVIVVLLSTPLVILLFVSTGLLGFAFLIFDIFDCLSFDKRVVRSCGVGVLCVVCGGVVVGCGGFAQAARRTVGSLSIFDYLSLVRS